MTKELYTDLPDSQETPEDGDEDESSSQDMRDRVLDVPVPRPRPDNLPHPQSAPEEYLSGPCIFGLDKKIEETKAQIAKLAALKDSGAKAESRVVESNHGGSPVGPTESLQEKQLRQRIEEMRAALESLKLLVAL